MKISNLYKSLVSACAKRRLPDDHFETGPFPRNQDSIKRVLSLLIRSWTIAFLTMTAFLRLATRPSRGKKLKEWGQYQLIHFRAVVSQEKGVLGPKIREETSRIQMSVTCMGVHMQSYGTNPHRSADKPTYPCINPTLWYGMICASSWFYFGSLHVHITLGLPGPPRWTAGKPRQHRTQIKA